MLSFWHKGAFAVCSLCDRKHTWNKYMTFIPTVKVMPPM